MDYTKLFRCCCCFSFSFTSPSLEAIHCKVGKNGSYVPQDNGPRPPKMFVKVIMCWLLSHEPFFFGVGVVIVTIKIFKTEEKEEELEEKSANQNWYIVGRGKKKKKERLPAQSDLPNPCCATKR